MAGMGQREKNLVGIAALAIMAAGAYWYFLHRPTAVELEATKTRVERLKVENDKAKAEVATGRPEEIRAQLAQYQKNLALIRTLVPTSNEVPALLEQVSTAARRVGLDLAAVTPQPVIQGHRYDTYRYNIDIAGNYHDVATFLTNVGSLTRIVAPMNLQLSQPSNPAAAKARAQKDAAVVDARFLIQTYVAKTSTVLPPPPTTGDN
ncbi:MAG: type 4a pilus biogenesis protein PilO [Gemmatimonadaceae bacterium]